jgi:hypothetical protein
MSLRINSLECHLDKDFRAIILADRAAAYSAIKKSEEVQADFTHALQCNPSDEMRAIIASQGRSVYSFNDLIHHNEDLLRHIFSILKDPHQSLVCKLWHKVNNSSETYRLILEMYRRQEFMARFTVQLPYADSCAYIKYVQQIFADVNFMVLRAGIKDDVKQAREKECLSLLELNPVMKMLEEEAVKAFFKTLSNQIIKARELLNSSLKAETIRAWMLDNHEKLHIVTELGLRGLTLTVFLPEIGLLIHLQELYLDGTQLAMLPSEIGQLINLQRLFLNRNKLKALPSEIGKLHNLEILDLSFNQLEQLPESVNQLTQLEYLNLENNKFAILPPYLRTLFDRGRLQCEGNPVCGLPREEWFSKV